MNLLTTFYWVFIWILVFAYYLTESQRIRRWMVLAGGLCFYAIALQLNSFAIALLIAMLVWVAIAWMRLGALTGSVLIFLPLVFYKIHASHFSFLPGHASQIPLGLSYLTLSLCGYFVDSRQSESWQRPAFNDFLPAAVFFPYLGAGPIVAIEEIDRQFKSSKIDPITLRSALLLILNGLTKKRIADLISVFSISGSPTQGLHSSSLERWASVIALGAEFYADFSGYTDIATGTALLFGIQLPENFRLPFLSSNMLEFWYRWHISLYVWTKKYIFQPVLVLFLDKLGRERAYLSLVTATFVALIFIGMWHGISLNFLAWGIYNALLIFVTPPFSRWLSKRLWGGKIFLIPLNFFFAVIGFCFVRFQDLPGLEHFLSSLFLNSSDVPISRIHIFQFFLCSMALVIPHLIDSLIIYKKTLVASPRIWCALVFLAILFLIVFPTESKPFIYFQF